MQCWALLTHRQTCCPLLDQPGNPLSDRTEPGSNEQETSLAERTWVGVAFKMSHGSWHFFLPGRSGPPPTGDQAAPHPLLGRPGFGCNIWREGAMEQVIQTWSCKPKPNKYKWAAPWRWSTDCQSQQVKSLKDYTCQALPEPLYIKL